MLKSVYRPKRTRNGKRIVSRLYRGKYRLEPGEPIRDIPLRTTDKRIAEKKLEQIVSELEQERAGILAPKPFRDGAQRKLLDHLQDCLADLRARGKNRTYVRGIGQRVTIVVNACGWEYPKDVSSDEFTAWRALQRKSPKTLNDYGAAMLRLLTWMKGKKRIPVVSFEVEPVEARGKQSYYRRAFTFEELRRLLAVSGPRRPVYVAAVHTGLRRGELNQLRWGDVFLDEVQPYLRVRASTAKNKRESFMPLCAELVGELRGIRRRGVGDGVRVFKGRMPRAETVKKDLRRAGIVRLDDQGRKVDFHALRHTFCTNMGVAGVPERLRQEAMRHSDARLTARIYTDTSRLQIVEAVRKLPRYLDDSLIASLGASQDGVCMGHEVAKGGTAAEAGEEAQAVAAQAKRREESRLDIPRQEPAFNEADGVRTRNLRIDSPML